MNKKQRLFALIFVGSVAVIATPVSLWALWEARSQKGTCDDLDRTICNATKHCYFQDEVHNEGDVPTCRRHVAVDYLGGVGITFSVALWVGFFMIWTNWHPVTPGYQNLCSAAVCLTVLILILAIYLLAMWAVLGSTTALVFGTIFGVEVGLVVLSDLAWRAADWLVFRQPPSYEELGELEKQ